MFDQRQTRAHTNERVLHDVLGGGVVMGQQPREPHRPRIRIPVEAREVVVHPTGDLANRMHRARFHASLDAAVCRFVA